MTPVEGRWMALGREEALRAYGALGGYLGALWTDSSDSWILEFFGAESWKVLGGLGESWWMGPSGS